MKYFIVGTKGNEVKGRIVVLSGQDYLPVEQSIGKAIVCLLNISWYGADTATITKEGEPDEE